jgi:hypothetical protein
MVRMWHKWTSLYIWDQIRYEVIREECGVKEDVMTKIQKNKLSWFGYVERMGERK